MSWRVDEAESWRGEVLSESRTLRGGSGHISHICIGWALSGGLEESRELEGGRGGVESRRQLTARLKAISRLSYDFRKGGRKELFGISETSVAFYVFLLSLVSRG